MTPATPASEKVLVASATLAGSISKVVTRPPFRCAASASQSVE
jgi:hypothetical protein